MPIFTNHERQILVDAVLSAGNHALIWDERVITNFHTVDTDILQGLLYKLRNQADMIVEQELDANDPELHFAFGGDGAADLLRRELIKEILREHAHGEMPGPEEVDSWMDEGLNVLCEGRVHWSTVTLWDDL